MAPLPPNSTARFRINYVTSGFGHTIQVRWGGSPSALSAAMTGILSGLTPIVAISTVLTVDFAAIGSNVFNPVTTGLEGLTYGAGAGTLVANAQYVNFVGRTTGGKRVRLAVFGALTEAVDFRVQPGESAAVDGAIAVLNDPGQPFLAIDGLKPIWKNYANAGQNVYWQKQVRA